MIAGYYTALERTLFFGEPSKEHLRYWEINVEVQRRGLELIKPGAGGYREHDILVVTEDGATNITHFPFGPEHDIIPA